MLEFDEEAQGPGRPVIKVIGVGGGGGNALNTMIEAGVEGVDFIVANTDGQVLEASLAGVKVHLGRNLTKGLGAGANPEIGRAAALEDASRVAEALTGADMVFVTAGMGGGTGTGAAPVIAQIARDCGALTVGVVTKPFAFEGSQRKKKAGSGINELSKAVDALIVIPNDRLVSLAGMKMTLKDAFAMVDNVCVNAVRGISDLVIAPGLINVDFADVRTIMTGMGRALMGTGVGSGDKRAIEAAQMAISSPLLEDVSINGATGILLNITGGPDLTLAEMNEACSLIAEAADPDANIIFGSVIDANAGDQVRITVIATGFQSSVQDHPAPSTGHRGPARGRQNQMALPMQAEAQAAQAAQSANVGAMPTAPWPPAQTATNRGGYAAPVSEPINTEDFYLNMEQVPPAAPAAGSEWTPPERPIIRPQSPGTAPLQRRASGQVPAQRPADELGVEESEFDKPTYLRRGLYAPE
ncbi:MAG TPA: cell division protein FtsZ [Polyangia bacterium]|jgi:cell division protein FtsZ